MQFVVFVTIVPKTPEQQKDIIQLLHDVRPAWLALPGSLSHDVGTAKGEDPLGTVYLTEIYSSPQGLDDFCKTSDHDRMKERLMPIIDAEKLVITQVVTNGKSK
ncbi:hypothetical protein CTheo_6450 [Ceratobasidium theobromae]|uniref:Stress-response A/B barrel domain-containing protein n=1 Tax=Ceratobasidium theobromae TaxID=1582974 RepID=A0A5N5QF64_9AGAM|nr:hypothetical protein CTheo_6450 [Ceratobasidium theobromae]